MDAILTFLDERAGLTAALFLMAIAAAVLWFVGAAMRSAGLSRKPVTFAGVFLAIILVPQLCFHLAYPGSASWKLRSESQDLTALFGPRVDPDLVRDARQVFPGVLDESDHARLALLSSGETALAAHFDSKSDAREAMYAYNRFFQVHNATGDQRNGWTWQRPTGDYARAVAVDNMLFAWTARDPQTLDLMPRQTKVIEAPAPSNEPDTTLLLAWLPVNLILAIVWFFKGAAWVARAGPTTAPPADLAILKARLLSINAVSVPVAVNVAGIDQFEVTWRLDRAWSELWRTRGKKREHKLILNFDGLSRTVRVYEYSSPVNSNRWRIARGLAFFNYEPHRSFGLSFDERGRPQAVENYNHVFHLQELKHPVITAVTSSGWTWKPVVLGGGPWLRWLTE